jgi:leucyl aminopeptidase
MPLPELHAIAASVPSNASSLASAGDALILLGPLPIGESIARAELGALGERILAAAQFDAALANPARAGRAPTLLPVEGAPGGRVIVAPTPSLVDDVDDVRLIAEATTVAVARATEAGALAPVVLLSLPNGLSSRFSHAREIAALAALGAGWTALEAREAGREGKAPRRVGVVGLDPARVAALVALEKGRALARDIGGTEPERMAPLKVAELCRASFAGTGVKIEVHEDVAGWPLLAAVARASQRVARHRPCVISLEVAPSEPATRTLILVGKGVTYDTGGADLKTDGAMAGMSRDKGGAAAVAGFVHAAAALKIPGLRVIGLLGMVRNSIGEESFVSDEIIVGKSGVRVRIGNTDAEGRLVLADLLATAKELATGAANPSIVSIATLTGHAYRAYGPYIAAIGNARAADDLAALDALGEAWGEPMERSRPRREDYAFVAGRSAAEDLVSSNRLPSVSTPRGHQFPFAFLDVASGLRGSGLPFVHLDIAGGALEPADWQFGRPTGAPVLTLAAWAERLRG